MFERYTEKARRVIFFARYEASQYGSPYIETEHLLLGLLREDYASLRRFLGPSQTLTQIRTEIERVITRATPISTSVEVPLSGDSKKILKLAAEEADGMKHRHVGTEHLLLGTLGVSDCLAAKLLTGGGVRAAAIREQLAKTTDAPSSPNVYRPPSVRIASEWPLDQFLAGLNGASAAEPAQFFGTKGRYIDSNGKCWTGREEISKRAGELFTPFAKRNATFHMGEVINAYGHTAVATVLWEFAACSGQLSKSIHRMSIVMAGNGDDWTVLLVQVTPVIPGPALNS